MNIASAIREISRAQRPLEENIELAGPGGQALDHSPTPLRKSLSEPPSSPPYDGADNRVWNAILKVLTYARKFPGPVLLIVLGTGIGLGIAASKGKRMPTR
jgi:hypothetical protein